MSAVQPSVRSKDANKNPDGLFSGFLALTANTHSDESDAISLEPRLCRGIEITPFLGI